MRMHLMTFPAATSRGNMITTAEPSEAPHTSAENSLLPFRPSPLLGNHDANVPHYAKYELGFLNFGFDGRLGRRPE